MAVKKSELYRSLWDGCDELRGGMDASQYKDYVLTLLFLKYVSDKYAGDPDGIILVPDGASFADLLALKGDKNIGEKINQIIKKLADDNGLDGVINVADFNDEDKLGKGKEMVDRLSKLVGIFDGLDLSANRAEGDDLLGELASPYWKNPDGSLKTFDFAVANPPFSYKSTSDHANYHRHRHRNRRPRKTPRQNPSHQTGDDARTINWEDKVNIIIKKD